MNFLLLCKRRYTNRDLIKDRFGRLFHLPMQLLMAGKTGLVLALDYRGSDIEETWVQGLNFKSLPFNIFQAAKFPGSISREVHSCKPDVIIASGDSHIGAIGAWIAHRRSIPFIFDVYDDYRVFGTNRIPGMKRLFEYALRRADLVIYASELLKQQLVSLTSSSLVLENGVDRKIFRRLDQTKARNAIGIGTVDPVIGYFGSIGSMHGVETLINAAGTLRADYPGLQLLIAGKLEVDLDLELPWIDYRGLVSQSQIALLINSCNVVVIPYHRGPQVDFSNACKMAEYLACEVPVVSTDVSDYAKFIANAQQAICIPEDSTDLARAIRAQIEEPQRIAFPESLSWEFLGNRLSTALDELVESQIEQTVVS